MICFNSNGLRKGSEKEEFEGGRQDAENMEMYGCNVFVKLLSALF